MQYLVLLQNGPRPSHLHFDICPFLCGFYSYTFRQSYIPSHWFLLDLCERSILMRNDALPCVRLSAKLTLWTKNDLFNGSLDFSFVGCFHKRIRYPTNGRDQRKEEPFLLYIQLITPYVIRLNYEMTWIKLFGRVPPPCLIDLESFNMMWISAFPRQIQEARLL